MKKTIPITKEINFRTMIGEMTEVSLEHTLALVEPYTIEGDLLVKGHYKMTEASTIEEEFEEKIPVSIALDEKYETDQVTVSVDDFYYEIINDNILRINIDLTVDGLELKEETLEEEEPLVINEEEKEPVIIDEEEKEEIRNSEPLPALDEVPEVVVEDAIPIPVEVEENQVVEKVENKDLNETPSSVNSIFSALQNTEETFSTYYVYIVQENDTIDLIMDKYKTTRECLQDYNNLDEIKVGSKIIIPCNSQNEAH